MKVFVVGASGLVGSNCLQKFKELGWDTKGSHLSFSTNDTVYFNTLDLTSEDNFDLKGFDPDVIVHTGALTWVDYCENNPEESYLKTVTSTKNLVSLAKRLNAKLVYYSTDYVFDGETGPYTEEATTNPVNIYGKHKLEAERIIKQELANNHLILRITNVYGDELRGKNFIARLLSAVRNKEEINLNLPYDQYATPLNANDIAIITSMLINDSKNGLYHLGGLEYLNRYQLAKLVLDKLQYSKSNLKSISTTEINPPAKRPLRGGLLSFKLTREYPQLTFSTVEQYIAQKKGLE